VVRKAETTKGLAWLKDKRAAWVDRLSLGGYLLAAAHLRKNGLEPDNIFAEQRFVGSYPDALKEVSFGQADVTSVTIPNDESVDTLAQYAGLAHAERLGKLAVTDATPNDALVFTGAMAGDRAEALAKRLFGSGPELKVPATLCMAFETEGFVAAAPGEYAKLRPLFGLS
jgi:phosphonate transport system substrate-binding protein